MSADNKKVVIHMGAHKTGTTSLQHFCVHNRDALLEQGLYYPDTANPETYLGPYGRYRFVNGYILTNKNYDASQFDKVLAEYQSNPAINTLFLSEENLFYSRLKEHKLSHRALKKLQQHNVHIVITLRRAIEYICGIWQEYVRFSCGDDLYTFFKKYNYTGDLAYIDTLKETFGEDRVHLLVYNEQETTDYDSVDHMMRFLGLHDHGLSAYDHRHNVGAHREVLDRMCFLNKYVPRAPYHKYRQYLPGNTQISVLNSLPDKRIKAICDRYYPVESKFAQKHLGRDYLYANRYPKIYGQERDAYRPDKSPLNAAIMRAVVREAFLDTHFKSRHSLNILLAEIYARLPADVVIKFRDTFEHYKRKISKHRSLSQLVLKIRNRPAKSVD